MNQVSPTYVFIFEINLYYSDLFRFLPVTKHVFQPKNIRKKPSVDNISALLLLSPV